MDFQVSARKWRPQKFSELIGQEHIVRTLTNAIELNRVSHAYLFSGTRGVGKTTTARILAKAINCQVDQVTEPCDQCNFCKEIKAGNSVDVLEIDGASKTSVDDVRGLIENIQYAASACRYKVYIIDEVHMISRNAFNALLKTLEEPPPNVVFIFATTVLSKIPETILSRCQCFEFKPLSHKQIVKQLEFICGQEGIQTNGLSLGKIAKTGAGSMRDAQSLLDQVIAYCGEKMENGSVEEVLGIVGNQTLEEFVEYLIKKDSASLIASVQAIIADGKDLDFLCRDLAEYLRNLMMVKLSDKPEALLDIQNCNLQVLQDQAEAFHTDELQQMFTVLSRTESEMKRSSLAKIIFEMSILRLTDVRSFQRIDDMIKAINFLEEKTKLTVPPTESYNPVEDETIIPKPIESSPDHRLDFKSHWQRIKQDICARKPVFNHYLTQCKVITFNEASLNLEFIDSVTLDQVKGPENLQLIKDAVKSVCHSEINVQLSLNDNARVSVESSSSNNSVSNGEEKKKMDSCNKNRNKPETEIIQDALDVFGGVVIK